ncbi:MAG TPA: DUF4149 domain-containing protein [Steroidobacteraceae bacterium]|nr:DUF4149 domain-containing protein [Steroidobacteraceae bacterium]
MRLARRLLLALWAGVLVTLALIVAPLLFATLADRHLAGALAGALFRIATLASLPLSLLLVVLSDAAPRGRRLWPLAPALLLSVSEWGVRPMLEAARAAGGAGSTAFAAWHGLSTGLYLVATALVVTLLVGELRD